MLQKSTLQFLSALKKNNNKPWFDENRKKFETAKEDFAAMVKELIKATAVFDEPIGLLNVKECTFRINRDVRFSKDKQPYKNNMAASLSKGGKKATIAGYYFHCEPGQSFAAGGFYTPMPPDLAKLRQEIDYGYQDWTKIIGSKTFQSFFPNGVEGTDTLVRPPKGYEEDNPAIHYLKMKGFIVSTKITDAMLQEKSAVKNVALAFKAMQPMINFLNKPFQ